MKKLWNTIAGLRFVILVLLLAFAADFALSLWAPVENSAYFTRNDYERAVLAHDGKTHFDKVFWGSSIASAGYMEAQSASGYANFGIVYGKITDLIQMLEKGYLSVDSDLVIMLNYLTFLDTLETNPTYPWHRGALEPYIYFQRDRLLATIEDAADALVQEHTLANLPTYTDYERSVCVGSMTDEELDERIAIHEERYFWQDLSNYQENFAALQQLIDYCTAHGIRLRAIYAPLNDYYDFHGYPTQVMQEVDRILKAADVDVLDMQHAISRDGFYDLGHLNREIGAVAFTNAIEEWLCA